MWMVLVRRVVKQNTHAREKYAPRSNNVESLHACGPFATERMAQVAALRAMGTHTCLEAQVWSEEQIRAAYARGAALSYELQGVLRRALVVLDVPANA